MCVLTLGAKTGLNNWIQLSLKLCLCVCVCFEAHKTVSVRGIGKL